jgi:hypothetical protein
VERKFGEENHLQPTHSKGNRRFRHALRRDHQGFGFFTMLRSPTEPWVAGVESKASPQNDFPLGARCARAQPPPQSIEKVQGPVGSMRICCSTMVGDRRPMLTTDPGNRTGDGNVQPTPISATGTCPTSPRGVLGTCKEIVSWFRASRKWDRHLDCAAERVPFSWLYPSDFPASS